jgi:predicted glycosyltransferase
VICRPGYTSLLDLLKLGKDAILIPTPGQAEQGYLAEKLQRLNYFDVQKQGEIELSKLSFGYNFELIQSFLSC